MSPELWWHKKTLSLLNNHPLLTEATITPSITPAAAETFTITQPLSIFSAAQNPTHDR